MRSRDPFGAALQELRRRLRRGELAPGAPLVVQDLARSLGLSATPVREALAHLAGEGIIETRRDAGRGYAAWPLSAADVAELYRLHAALTLFGLAEAQRRGARLGLIAQASIEDGASIETYVAQSERLFAAIVRAAGSRALWWRHAGLCDRLHLIRLGEPDVLSEAHAELEGLATLEPSRLGPAVRAYHRRRIAAADRLAVAVSAGPQI